MADDIYTKRPISHDEARAIADRLIASHFRKHDFENARISIPANPERDDDLLIGAYILQQREAAAEITRLRSQLAVAREALNLVRDGLRNLPRSKTADQIDVICAEALQSLDEARSK